tara:strand:+ start:20 stop:262 length:243 start_codon:yes stop_codon:yes gene_type:complete
VVDPNKLQLSVKHTLKRGDTWVLGIAQTHTLQPYTETHASSIRIPMVPRGGREMSGIKPISLGVLVLLNLGEVVNFLLYE